MCRALGCSQVGELRASRPGGVSEPRAPRVCIRIVLPCRLFGQIIVIELCPVITSIKKFFNPNKESPPAQSTLPRQVPWSFLYMVGLPFHFSPHGSQNQNAQFRESVSLLSETRFLESDLKFRLRSTVPGSGSKDSPPVFCHHFMGNRWGNSGNSDRPYFLGSKITPDGDCSHEIKRHLLLGRKVITNLDNKDITLLIKAYIVKAMVFPTVVYGCESWTIKKAEHHRCF